MITKQTKLSKISSFLISIAYGLIITSLIQINLDYVRGDINEYVRYFNEINSLEYFLSIDYGKYGDYIFRYVVILLTELSNIDVLNILKFVAFITSSIVFYIFVQNLKQRNHYIYLSFLFLIIFLTPRVFDLFGSGIRSSLGFTLVLLSIIYLKGINKILIFLISVWIHFSMIPIIGLYYLFHTLNSKWLKVDYAIANIVLLMYAFFINVAAGQFYRVFDSASSIRFQIVVFFLGLMIIFTSKETVKNIYGFIAIGTISILLIGFIIGYSFERYLGYAILFYLFFLIRKGDRKTIQLFSFTYLPFFIITLYYSITNLI